MVKLKHYHWDKLREWFCPSPGYVLEFSNRTFKEFFEDHFEVNIYADTFSKFGTSKFNRLRAFIEVSPPHVVIEVLNKLWTHRNGDRDSDIEIYGQNWRSDFYNQNYLSELCQAAAEEDLPFRKLIDEIDEPANYIAANPLKTAATEWNMDTLRIDIDRALRNIDTDPEAAITAACSLLESVCRSIIIGRGCDLPKIINIQTLYKVVREPLGLAAGKDVSDEAIASDVRTILSAAANMIQGIGSLRSHTGSAHGRERGFKRVDTRIARLAVNAAFAAALFLVETWEKKFPDDRLLVDDNQ